MEIELTRSTTKNPWWLEFDYIELLCYNDPIGVYIYIYIERERERERDYPRLATWQSL